MIKLFFFDKFLQRKLAYSCFHYKWTSNCLHHSLYISTSCLESNFVWRWHCPTYPSILYPYPCFIKFRGQKGNASLVYFSIESWIAPFKTPRWVASTSSTMLKTDDSMQISSDWRAVERSHNFVLQPFHGVLSNVFGQHLTLVVNMSCIYS